MANVKAGDLAYITHPSQLGKLVNVLDQAPAERFELPDGFTHIGVTSALMWVCESLGAPFRARVGESGKSHRTTRYAVIPDRWLRPIRGEGLADTEPTSTTLPERTEA